MWHWLKHPAIFILQGIFEVSSSKGEMSEWGIEEKESGIYIKKFALFEKFAKNV